MKPQVVKIKFWSLLEHNPNKHTPVSTLHFNALTHSYMTKTTLNGIAAHWAAWYKTNIIKASSNAPPKNIDKNQIIQNPTETCVSQAKVQRQQTLILSGGTSLISKIFDLFK